MRLILSICLLLILNNSIFGQIHDPVKWKFSSRQVSNNEFEVTFTATIAPGWSIYGQKLGIAGPIPTTFEFDKVQGVQLIGSVQESGNKKVVYDEIFGGEVTKIYTQAVFTQKVKVDNPSKTIISGGVDFMCCDDEMCLPPKFVPFKIRPEPSSAPPPSPEPIDEPDPLANIPTYTKPQPVKGSVSYDKPNTTKGLPVSWTVEGIRATKDEYEVTFRASIRDDWFIYNQNTGAKGPMPTTFEFDNRDNRLEFIKKATETGNKRTIFDPTFKMNLVQFTGEVTFTQRFKIKSGSRKVVGNIYYVTSDGKQTIPPLRVGFSIELPSKITPTEADIKKMQREARRKAAALKAKREAEEKARLEAEQAADTTQKQDVAAVPQPAAKPVNISSDIKQDARYQGSKFDYTLVYDNCEESEEKGGKSNWIVFLLGFGGGLIALLTPCVFPMVPITVSFFTKTSKSRREGIQNAIIYGLSIIAIYVSLGLIITGVFGADALNQMSTNAIINLLFFAIFVWFAFSFFGFYEITLPSSWANQTDQAADRGGLIGIFFMAFTLSLVSFSCTGPIIGSLLVETASGGGETVFGRIPVRPLLGMSGFSLALALPFALFAAFPGWLNSLPKSGSWMNTVKVTLGFTELALALKFLSVADLTYHWGFLRIEVFLGLWILNFLGLAAYMFGFLRFPHDEPQNKPNIPRILIGMASLALVGYLATGFNYKPLALLSGIAPPSHYNFLQDKSKEQFPDCPQGIRCYKDYDEGLEIAKKLNLPVMLDFTGHGCVNCRKMEENVWDKDDVKRLLSEEYVLISLYCDDREKLPASYRAPNGELVRTVGNKWTQFQIEHFGSNAQPLYVLMDNDERILNAPKVYTPDVKEYVKFLECGLQNREK